MIIPMVDLKTQYAQLKTEIDRSLSAVLEDCRFVLGPTTAEFESQAAAYLGCRHAIGCGSGTDALHLALRAAGIGPGDEVITSAFTFIATAEAIRYVDAIPVFVDIDPRTYNLDSTLIEASITPRTKAIMPVHLFGQPVDMPAIQRIAEKHGLKIIEDCAQSFGAAIGGTMTGNLGDFGCFSFFPSKNLGCYGDGGLITTNSDNDAKQLRMLRHHGSSQQYHHDIIGYNSRLDEIQAAILSVKLKHIDRFNHERRRVAEHYNRLLADTDVITPYADGIGNHIYHQYTTLMPQRERVMQHLREQQIACAVYYPVPLHQQKVFDMQNVKLPVTENISTQCLSLPIFPEMQAQQIEHVVAQIKSVLA